MTTIPNKLRNALAMLPAVPSVPDLSWGKWVMAQTNDALDRLAAAAIEAATELPKA